MLLPGSLTLLGWALRPNLPPSAEGIFSPSPHFPLTTWCGLPDLPALQRGCPYQQPELGEAYRRGPHTLLGRTPLRGRPAQPRRGLASAAGTSAGFSGQHAHQGKGGRGEPCPAPTPGFPAGGNQAIGPRGELVRLLPSAFPDSPLPRAALRAGSRSGNVSRTPRKRLAPTPPGTGGRRSRPATSGRPGRYSPRTDGGARTACGQQTAGRSGALRGALP